MPSNKINRINDDIQLALSSLLRSVKDPRVQQGLLSVTRVETTGDLRYCKVYISVLGLQDEKELKRGLKSAAGWLRRELGSRVHLRYTPELIFEVDKSIAQGAHLNALMHSLEAQESGAPAAGDGEEEDA